ncbi:MAG TPA: hypothetical protein VMX75_07895 [Spirochaetia bacterium]|nr:hypothetical protein [Spirochaetia bacterium]
MAVSTHRRDREVPKRLVGVILILLSLPLGQSWSQGYPLRLTGADGEVLTLRLREEPEILNSTCKRLHDHPLIYLAFLPGPLLFLVLYFLKRRSAGSKKGAAKSIGPSLMVVFCLPFLLGVQDPDPSVTALLRQGIEAAQSEHYEEALKYFQTVADTMGCSASLSYDMALCCYASGRGGYAVHYLRKSIRDDPRDPALRKALSAVEGNLDLSSQISPPIALHPALFFILTVVFFNLTFVALVFVYLFKKGAFAILFVLIALLSLGSFSLFIYTLGESRQNGAVVKEGQGELKKIPLDEAQIWFSLKEGTSLRVTGRAQGYLLVRTGQGLEGWIRAGEVLID